MKDKDLLLRLTFCLAVGGLGTVAVMCLFVGFGFSTVIGKEAVYLCLVLQAVHVAVMHSRENRLLRSSQAPLPSKKMRCIRAFAAWLWRLGALTLVASLFLILIGMLMSSLWVVLTCWIGFFAMLAGWLLRLMTFHRLCQSSIALAMEKERVKQKKVS